MATLLEICQDAITGVQDIAKPDTIVGNSSPNAMLLKTCAQDIGRFLERKYSWQALKRSYSFATSEGVTGYDIPEEMRRFSNMTIWSETDEWPLIRVTDKGWRTLKSGITSSGIRFYYSVFNNDINLDPAPGATSFTIVFDYYSKYFCETAGGTGIDRWAADDDVSRLDGNMMTLGIRYRYLARQGLPYEEEKAEFFDAVSDLRADDRPLDKIDVGRTTGEYTVNVPDGAWSL